MSGLEQAIRNALERADRTDAETRARIYQSARNALETGLRKQDVHDRNVISQQRHRLEMIIHGIETEEREALKVQAQAQALAKDEAVASPRVRIDPPATRPPVLQAPVLQAPLLQAPATQTFAARSAAGTLDEAPAGLSARREPESAAASPSVDDGLSSFRPERRGNPEVDTASGPSTAETVAVRPSTRTAKAPRRRRGRLLSLFLVLTTLLVAFGTAVWWIETNGLLLTDEERDTGVSNPPATVQSEDFSPEGLRTLGAQAGFSGDWVEAFTPANAGDIDTRGDATIDVVSEDAGQAVRLTSRIADRNGEVLVPIPASLLEQMSGKTSTLALTVQSTTEEPLQFYVECEFAALGKCGRHRFSVSGERSDVLLKVAFDRSLAPSGAGHLIINSDISGGGKSLDLYAVRVLPGE